MALAPRADKTRLVRPCVLALTVLEVIDPLAIVRATLFIGETTVAMSQVILKVALVFASVLVSGHSGAVTSIFDPFSIVVEFCVRPCVPAFSMLHVIFPHALILENSVFSMPNHLALPMSLVVGPLALIRAAIIIHESSATLLLSVLPLPRILRILSCPDQSALPMVLIVKELSFVYR